MMLLAVILACLAFSAVGLQCVKSRVLLEDIAHNATKSTCKVILPDVKHLDILQ